jgi:hypothetical protein
MRFSEIIVLGFLSTIASAGAAGEDPVYVTVDISLHQGRMPPAELEYVRGEADRFASVSHLPLLKSGGSDELRLWYSWATFNPRGGGVGTVGYVFSGRSPRVCRIVYRGESVVPARASCTRLPITVQRRERIFEYLQRLSAFGDCSVNCEVADGDWVSVDAVANGTRFVLFASNPDDCQGDFAKLVSGLVEEATRKARP